MKREDFSIRGTAIFLTALIAVVQCAPNNPPEIGATTIRSTLASIVSTISAAFSSTPAPETKLGNSKDCKVDEDRFGCWMSPSHEDCACGNTCAPQNHDHLRFFRVKDDCVAALLSDKVSLWANDPCMNKPCQNGGKCVLTEEKPGYKCLCSASGATGFTGQNCNERCPPPKMENENKTVLYSHDCLHLW